MLYFLKKYYFGVYKMTNIVSVLLANWKTALIGGVVVVSAIIVIMGALKFLFNKIKNKYLRKTLLAFSSVLLAMPATAIYFASAHISFHYYWIGYGMTAVATIITYWLYENTCLRELIQKIGTLTIGKVWSAIVEKIGGKNSKEAYEETAKTLGITGTKSNNTSETSTVRIPIGETKTIPTATNKVAQKENEEINKL